MKQQGVSLRFSLHSDQGGKTPGETFLYKLLKCLLRFGNAPLTDRRGTVLLLISLRSAVRCRGAPSGGGGLAVPRHSSSLHQRPPRSAILGLSTQRGVRADEERWEMETIEPDCGQKWDKRGRKWMEKGLRVRLWVCETVCVCEAACLHMFFCVF